MKSLLQEVAADARWPLRLAEAFERLRAAADAEQAQASR